MLYAYKKSDAKQFPCHPTDICHEWDGDVIPDFLSNPRSLAEYRKIFEPVWNPALTELQAGRVSPAEKIALSGYMGNLLVCTPTWRRIGIEGHNFQHLQFLHASDIFYTEMGKPDPKIKEMVAAFDSGSYSIDTKPDYIRALCAKNLMGYAWSIYNADRIVIKNNTETAFLISDNPVSFDDPGPGPSRGGEPRFPRYLPVTPRLCLHFDISQYDASDEANPDFTRPPKGTVRIATISPRGARRINRAVVQCAEEIVISSEQLESVEKLVRKYATYRVAVDFIEIRQPDGFLVEMHTRVRPVAGRNSFLEERARISVAAGYVIRLCARNQRIDSARRETCSSSPASSFSFASSASMFSSSRGSTTASGNMNTCAAAPARSFAPPTGCSAVATSMPAPAMWRAVRFGKSRLVGDPCASHVPEMYGGFLPTENPAGLPASAAVVAAKIRRDIREPRILVA
jgi:hypothetical protein